MSIKHLHYKYTTTLIFCLLLFMLNSFFSVVVFSVCALRKKDVFSHYYTWGILFALFISVFNASKIPENDLAMYLDYFRLTEYIPLKDYIYILGDWGKDILYLAYTWILHLIIGNSDKLFVFVMSFTSYILFLKALLIACNHLKLNNSSIFLCLVILFFHPYIFATSAHILRQTIAFSITTYVLAKKIFEQKNMWYLGLAAALFHGSVLFFVPFLFLNILYKPITLKKLLIIFAIVETGVSIKSIAAQLRAMGLPISFFNFALQRAADGTTFDASLALKQLVGSLILIVFLFFLMYIKKRSLLENYSYNFFFNLATILFIFIVINKESGELQHRFNMFFWQLHPIFLAFFLAVFNHIRPTIKFIIAFLTFFSWIVYNNLFSPWTYECGNLFWLYPAFMYFL